MTWPKRLVLVDDGLFCQIVNSNLEVRTSVSIDPITGAAKEGALFTYEALPRASLALVRRGGGQLPAREGSPMMTPRRKSWHTNARWTW